MIRVGIFGSNGYLGKAIIESLKSKNINYILLPRNIDLVPMETLVEITHFIDCSFPKNYFDDFEFNNYLSEINLRVWKLQNNNKKYLYLGSFSSINGGFSIYGQRKLMIEEVFRINKFEVLRIGLVIDFKNLGGRALEFYEVLKKFPIIPLPHRNWFPLYVTELHDFQNGILQYLRKGSVTEINIAKLKSLSSVASELAFEKKKVQIPEFFTLILVIIIRFIPIKKLDSLRSICVRLRDDNFHT